MCKPSLTEWRQPGCVTAQLSLHASGALCRPAVQQARVWEMRSEALLKQGQWRSALDANAYALRIDPFRNGALGNQGFLLLLNGRPAVALSVLDRAIALDPRSQDIDNYLQLQCSAHLNLGQHDEAITVCEKALVLEENWLKYLFCWARLLRKVIWRRPRSRRRSCSS